MSKRKKRTKNSVDQASSAVNQGISRRDALSIAASIASLAKSLTPSSTACTTPPPFAQLIVGSEGIPSSLAFGSGGRIFAADEEQL